MARTRERVFAWFGVAVAIVSAAALSVAVIIQQVTTGSTADTTAQTQNRQVKACTDNNTEDVLAAPAPYTVSGAVSSLETTDITAGTGPAAKAGDCLVVKYYGTLAKDGTLFDENYTKATAFAFMLGQGQVIQGWEQGVVGMQAGGERRLLIPASLAYGNQAQGSIPANSDLVFYVKLLRVQ